MLSLVSKLLLIFPLIPLLAFTFIPPHAIYVSILEIRYDEEWGDLNLQVKIFSDDLENALQTSANRQLFLRPDQESPNIDGYLQAYLNEKIQLRSRDGNMPLHLVRKKFVEDATWIYLKAYGSCNMTSLTVKSSILLELFDAQTNIIRLKANGENYISNLDRQIQEKKFSIRKGTWDTQ